MWLILHVYCTWMEVKFLWSTAQLVVTSEICTTTNDYLATVAKGDLGIPQIFPPTISTRYPHNSSQMGVQLLIQLVWFTINLSSVISREIVWCTELNLLTLFLECRPMSISCTDLTIVKIVLGYHNALWVLDNVTFGISDLRAQLELVGHGLWLLGHMPQCAPAWLHHSTVPSHDTVKWDAQWGQGLANGTITLSFKSLPHYICSMWLGG